QRRSSSTCGSGGWSANTRRRSPAWNTGRIRHSRRYSTDRSGGRAAESRPEPCVGRATTSMKPSLDREANGAPNGPATETFSTDVEQGYSTGNCVSKSHLATSCRLRFLVSIQLTDEEARKTFR